MYCPACGIENNQEASRFCRACGADLRAVSRAMNKSLPVQIASTVDAYLENRYQQNMRSGIVNILAFVALLSVGLGHIYFGWTKLGAFMLALSAFSFFFGVWDIWIYRRNLPPIAKPLALPSDKQTNKLSASEPQPPRSVVEPTTKKLELENNKR